MLSGLLTTYWSEQPLEPLDSARGCHQDSGSDGSDAGNGKVDEVASRCLHERSSSLNVPVRSRRPDNLAAVVKRCQD